MLPRWTWKVQLPFPKQYLLQTPNLSVTQNKENNEGNIDSAFVSILPYLQQLSGKWFVMGSYGLKLQGMDISCDVTSHADAEWLRGELRREFEEVFGDNAHGDRFRSTFVRFMVNGYRVEIQGDLEAKTDNQWINIYASSRPITRPLF